MLVILIVLLIVFLLLLFYLVRNSNIWKSPYPKELRPLIKLAGIEYFIPVSILLAHEKYPILSIVLILFYLLLRAKHYLLGNKLNKQVYIGHWVHVYKLKKRHFLSWYPSDTLFILICSILLLIFIKKIITD